MERKLRLVAAAALAFVVLTAQSLALAQERDPLAMRIELEWTIAGSALGALLGAAIWLTDPGNPSITLSGNVIEGAALGAIAGAGFGYYIILQNIQFPPEPVQPPPPQATNPDNAQFAAVVREASLPSFRIAERRGGSFPLAQFKLRF